MDWLKVWQLIQMIAAIISALRNGESVLNLLKEKAPGLIQLVQDLAKKWWPNLNEQDLTQAGALMLDTDFVKMVQGAINKLGIATLIVDGSYGPLTIASVKLFQTANGLTVDGWAGKLTWAALQFAAAKLEAPTAMAKVTEAQAVAAKP